MHLLVDGSVAYGIWLIGVKDKGVWVWLQILDFSAVRMEFPFLLVLNMVNSLSPTITF